jgi:hypothetical protein
MSNEAKVKNALEDCSHKQLYEQVRHALQYKVTKLLA